MEDSFEKSTFVADFGSGRSIDLEFPAVNALWVVAGTGIDVAEIWFREIDGVDLRARIMRLGNTLEVSIDRGDQSASWWPPQAAPRLFITLNQIEQTASATASVGAEEQTRTVELGSMRY